jgi:class 3 adenylate cyclase
MRELVPIPLGVMSFSPLAIDTTLDWRGHVFSVESYRAWLHMLGPWVLHDLPGGRVAALEQLDPRVRDVIDGLAPSPGPEALTYSSPGAHSAGASVNLVLTAVRVRDRSGRLHGTAIMVKPAAPMALIGMMTSVGDTRHFARMLALAETARRPAAILFADLEGSSMLSRRLSTVSYFKFGRRLVRLADECVVDAGGVVGRNAGDGVAAIFLAQHAGSESAAARDCVCAMRAIRAGLPHVAERSGLEPGDVVLRFGLHWGATLYVGQVITAARGEVNAFGDEMNEAARIEACAAGGRTLASKALVERLEPEDAEACGVDLQRVVYTALGALPTASEKARRDAPAIAVCEV